MCPYTRAGKSEGLERLRQKVQDIFAMYCTVLYCTFPGYSIPSPPHLDDLQIILYCSDGPSLLYIHLVAQFDP